MSILKDRVFRDSVSLPVRIEICIRLATVSVGEFDAALQHSGKLTVSNGLVFESIISFVFVISKLNISFSNATLSSEIRGFAHLPCSESFFFFGKKKIRAKIFILMRSQLWHSAKLDFFDSSQIRTWYYFFLHTQNCGGKAIWLTSQVVITLFSVCFRLMTCWLYAVSQQHVTLCQVDCCKGDSFPDGKRIPKKVDFLSDLYCITI